jgi:hypothetical protein
MLPCSPKIYVMDPNPGTSDVSICGDRTFQKATRLKCSHWGEPHGTLVADLRRAV